MEKKIVVAADCRQIRDKIFFPESSSQVIFDSNSNEVQQVVSTVSKKIASFAYNTEVEFQTDIIEAFNWLHAQDNQLNEKIQKIKQIFCSVVSSMAKSKAEKQPAQPVSLHEMLAYFTTTLSTTKISTPNQSEQVGSRGLSKISALVDNLCSAAIAHAEVLTAAAGSSRPLEVQSEETPSKRSKYSVESSAEAKAIAETPKEKSSERSRRNRGSDEAAPTLPSNSSPPMPTRTIKFDPNRSVTLSTSAPLIHRIQRQSSQDENSNALPPSGDCPSINCGVGVLLDPSNQCYRAELRIYGRIVHLGTFRTSNEAARAHDLGIIRCIGPENCQERYLNFRIEEYASLPLATFLAYDDILRRDLNGSAWTGPKACDFKFLLLKREQNLL